MKNGSSVIEEGKGRKRYSMPDSGVAVVSTQYSSVVLSRPRSANTDGWELSIALCVKKLTVQTTHGAKVNMGDGLMADGRGKWNHQKAPDASHCQLSQPWTMVDVNCDSSGGVHSHRLKTVSLISRFASLDGTSLSLQLLHSVDRQY